MINLIGAYITLIFIVAVLYHRPPVKKYDDYLIRHVYLSYALVCLGGLLLLNDLFGLFSLGGLFYPLYLIDMLVETTTLWIHEAGHVYWSIGGTTLAVLGGTLNEVLFPIVLFGYSYWMKAFGFCAISTFWLGKNCFGISIYMADARARELPLFGGAGTHDWEYLFGKLGLLEFDTTVSMFVYLVGLVLCVLSLGYFAYRVWRPNSKVAL